MENIRTITVEIPESEYHLFADLAKQHGWETFDETISTTPSLRLAIEDIREGRLIKAKNADEMIRQILGD